MSEYTMKIENIEEREDGSALVTFDIPNDLAKEYIRIGLKKVIVDSAIRKILESKTMDIIEQLKMAEDETGINMAAASEIEKVRIMIADFIQAWRWYQEDEYDREAPHDCVYEMIKYMENLGYKIDHHGISRINDENSSNKQSIDFHTQ